MSSTIKVIVAGSRDFSNYELCQRMLDRFLSQKENIEIVSGGAKGADALGERYAVERGYKLTKFPADWTAHGKAAGPIRNQQMAQYADYLVAFWDGISRGTANMLYVAEEEGLTIRVINYQQK